MNRKFSQELEIRLDNHQNKIINKEQIINKINEINDPDEIKALKEYYYRNIEMLSSGEIAKDLREIVDKIKEREVSLKSGEIFLQADFNELKSENDNLRNINIIDTAKENNDKIDGLRKGVTYLQIRINGENQLYEITNIKAIQNFLYGNKEELKKMSEKEIIDVLKQYAVRREMSSIDTRPNDRLTSDTIKKEINRINDPHVKEVFIKEESNVLKERVDLKKYVDINMPGAEIKYGLNSNGERIYMVEDKVIKFVGEKRTMQVLTKDDNEKTDVGTSSFATQNSGSANVIDIKSDIYVNIEDFLQSISALNYIIEAVSLNLGVTDNQIEFLTKFMSTCVSTEEMGGYIPGELETIYEKYYNYAKGNKKYTNDDMNKIIERKEAVEKIKELEKKEKYVKKLELKDSLSTGEKAGFISVAIILEASVILGGVLAILALVKK